MNKSYKILLSILAFCFSFSSCTKNLELEPISQISNSSFWKTENDAQGALNGMYARLRDQAASNFFLLGEARSEVMGPSVSGGQGKTEYRGNTINKTNFTITWQGFYTVIHDANLIIKSVPQIKFASEAAKNNVLAQAYTTRAFVYFMMARTWGDLIIITEPTAGYSTEATQKQRSPVADVFAFIKKDLTEASKLFSNNSYPTGRHMWSNPSLNALIADVYLWTGKRLNGGTADFTIALNALNAIEGTDVQLLSDFGSVFDYTNKGNKEILMAIRFRENESPATLFEYMYVSGISLPKNIDDATKDAIGALKYDEWSVSDLVRNQFSVDDQRKNASILEIFTIGTGGAKTYYGSIITKFNGVVSGGTRLFMDDVVVYRYADVLLMKAEAKNALGQDPSPEINKVRQRAYGSKFANYQYVNSTKVVNDAAILKERLLELTFEGKRWWDLVRFGKTFEIVPSLQNRAGQDFLLLFPIAETTLALESGVKQNPGY